MAWTATSGSKSAWGGYGIYENCPYTSRPLETCPILAAFEPISPRNAGASLYLLLSLGKVLGQESVSIKEASIFRPRSQLLVISTSMGDAPSLLATDAHLVGFHRAIGVAHDDLPKSAILLSEEEKNPRRSKCVWIRLF